MNLVQANIQEIKKEKIVVIDEMTCVNVQVVVNMWGSIREIRTSFLLSEWEDAKKKGYFYY